MSTTTTTRQKAGITEVATTSRNWKITNNCKSVDLVVIYCTTAETVPTRFFYAQDIQIITLTEQQKTIPAGTTSSIAVPTNTVHPNNDITFILANAATLFPVFMQTFSASATDFPDTLVVDADVTKMTAALKFFQEISATPDGKLAVDFANALNDANPAVMVAAFFAATKGYKTVTLDAVHAVQSYYEALPYGWAGEGKDKTYYLYTSERADSLPVGRLEIKNKWVSPLPTDASDFKATLYVDGKASKALFFSNGVFTDDLTKDEPLVALTGSFCLESSLTNNPVQTDMISYLVGNLNGVKALGVDYKVTDNNQKDAGFYEMLHPANLKEVVDVFLYAVSVGIGIFFVIKLVKTGIWLKKNVPEGWEQLMTKAKELIRGNSQRVVSQVNPDAVLPEPEILEADQSELAKDRLDLLAITAKRSLQTVIDAHTAALNELLPYGTSSDLRAATKNIKNATEQLQVPDQQFLDNLADTVTGLKACTQSLTKRRTALEGTMKTREKRTVDTALEVSTEEIESIGHNNEVADEIKDRLEFEEIIVER